jgi:predicted nucleotidyltransferase
MRLPPDFKELLRLLNSHAVEYLLVGGYAVGYYGYPRPTGDLDIWVSINPANAGRTAKALIEFGFSPEEVSAPLFRKPDRIIRMGVPPIRVEVITGVSGIEFDACYERRESAEIDGVPVNIICLDDLKANKKAAGRHKDLNDLEQLS